MTSSTPMKFEGTFSFIVKTSTDLALQSSINLSCRVFNSGKSEIRL